MSSSKIFSGDLPELIYEIIEHFQNDYLTLHSCILVNKLWCRLAIPLLWENPFSITTGNYNFIKVYLYNLNKYLKATLSKYQIIDSLLTSNTLFNYPSFIRYLNINKINTSIDMWLKANDITLNIDLVFEFKNFINMSLIKLFIENEVNLHTLDLEASNTNYVTYIEHVLEIILQNPNFISNNIRNLKFSISSSGSKILNRVTQIINSNQNLKKISFIYNTNTFLLYQSLLLSKESNCSNTLNTIVFYYINFNRINNLDKIFEQLNVLESVHIFFCYSLNSFIQKIINLPKPFKLKSLFTNEKLRIELLPLLLQKSGDYLENFECELNYDEQRLLELITKYCKNIKFLDIYGFENHFTSLIFNLIENIKQNLNYLSIGVDYQNGNIESNSILLQNLGQILPPKLEYLNLVLYFKVNDFKIFLRNSQGTFIKKLLINQKGSDDILHCIKEFIMKEKRVKYLAIRNSNNGELCRFENEAKEFELYNIKLQYYYAIFIYSYNYMKELY
ncbi:uncharacterized protein OCT59_019109 [Rhizophagus irregularis]|uniref:uncharacterized protein n=1 Tax=Rhizophagus irregularis TaxID=588596 RepID=UPI000CA68E7C|nr:hypothetical protein OCT59_019109 [Rhizophagus irregularis]GBC33996.1 hypothetical protein GLOIN_2v1790153 [Rhizophagus irregularis DAOM 181602=DAOM 197198]